MNPEKFINTCISQVQNHWDDKYGMAFLFLDIFVSFYFVIVGVVVVVVIVSFLFCSF